jgi:hypothetical protein
MKPMITDIAGVSHALPFKVGTIWMQGTSSMPVMEVVKTRLATTPETYILSVVPVTDSRAPNIVILESSHSVIQPSCSKNMAPTSLTNWKRLKNSLGSVIKNLKNRLGFSEVK